MTLTGQPLSSVSHACSCEYFASNRSISDALWCRSFTDFGLDQAHPGCALPPHDDDGVLAVPPEHGAEVQPLLLPLLLHALQHVPLLQLVHAIHLSAVLYMHMLLGC